jgi:hypothetical protein
VLAKAWLFCVARNASAIARLPGESLVGVGESLTSIDRGREALLGVEVPGGVKVSLVAWGGGRDLLERPGVPETV